MKSELTIIIPFRNEGIEVYNTVKNVKETSDANIDIILINDGSDDNFDYGNIAQMFHAEYIQHLNGKGVAASRNEGVLHCKTDFFMFLDAHMRAFTPNWTSILINELKKDMRAVFCCQTVSIDKNGTITNPRAKGYGVHIDFNNLLCDWNNIDPSGMQSVSKIPCIMGASYASNKRYWNKIHGLNGLRSYGFDEQLISMKTILEGGSCKIIKDIVFGHMFRILKDVPYKIDTVDYVFNQLYIIELFYPIEQKIPFFRWIKSQCEEQKFNLAVDEIIKIQEEISNEKKYYKELFNNDFHFLTTFNSQFK